MANKLLDVTSTSLNKNYTFDESVIDEFKKMEHDFFEENREVHFFSTSSFRIEGKKIKDIVLELSKTYPVFLDIYLQEDFLSDGSEWFEFKENCKKNNLLTKHKLIEYYKDSPIFNERI